MAAQTFEVGTEYATRSYCDYDCIYRFTVVGRTAKSVQLAYHGRVTTRRVRVNADGIECVSPMGTYSMSPNLRADQVSA